MKQIKCSPLGYQTEKERWWLDNLLSERERERPSVSCCCRRLNHLKLTVMGEKSLVIYI